MLMARDDRPAMAPTINPRLVSIEAEVAMLSMLLNDNRRVDSVADLLVGSDFFEPLYGRIYDRIVQLVSAGHQANPITLPPFFNDDPQFAELGGVSLIANLTGGNSSMFLLMRPADQANIIADLAARRRLVASLDDIGGIAHDRDVTLADLRDYPMPMYDGDLEMAGMPAEARSFRELLRAHDAFVIASPEYNGSFSGLLKNTIDWTSRGLGGERPGAVFNGKRAALLSASPGGGGGQRGLRQTRELLEIDEAGGVERVGELRSNAFHRAQIVARNIALERAMDRRADDVAGEIAGRSCRFPGNPASLARRDVLHVRPHRRAIGQGDALLRPKQDERQGQRHHDDDQPPIFADQVHPVSLTNSIVRCSDGEARANRRRASPKESPGSRRPRPRRSAGFHSRPTSLRFRPPGPRSSGS